MRANQHANQNASRLAAVGLALILLFLSGFALWGAITTNQSANEAKRASVISDGYRLARYSLALEDLVMTTYLTLPDYQSHRLVPPGPGTGASLQGMAMPGMLAAYGNPLPGVPAQMQQSIVPPDGPGDAMVRTAKHRAITAKHGAMMPKHDAMTAKHGAMMPKHGAMMPTHSTATPRPAAVGKSQAALLPTGTQLRLQHERAATQLLQGIQIVMLTGDAADRRLATDVLRRHAMHMAYAMQMFEAVDRHQPGRALWIQVHELGPSFSFIEQEVDQAARIHRLTALRKLGELSSTESLVFTGTIIAFAVGLALLATLSLLLRSYAKRIEDTRKSELDRLAEVAVTDNLTGLRNHRAFQEDLARQFARRDELGAEFSLLLLDLNGLKQVNDNYGHQKGDEQLIELANCIERTVRRKDMAYRIGGDEFAILLDDVNAWGGLRLVDRLNLELMASPVVPQPSAAVGIAESTDKDDKDTLIQHADIALIQAKRSEKACIVYSEGLPRELRGPAEDLDEGHRATLTTALARAVDAKDSYTRSHSETVSELCGLIAAELGLDVDRCSRVRLAGLLHDVGKIGIADAILKKPAKLTTAEFEIMKSHSTLGHTIVMGAALAQEAQWILHHHERYDGTGYPSSLRGEEIPLESRIILVADAFEAMTSDRPYRKGRPDEEALLELDRCAGSQFDPACVSALKRALRPHHHEEQQDRSSPPATVTLDV